MKKVSDIGEKQKACVYCGALPACPDWTCKRLSSVAIEGESIQVWFVEEPETTVEVTFTPDDAA